MLYIDPPYIDHEKDYVNKIEPDDHKRLAEMLHRFERARIVISYYDHPKLDELYPDWQRHEIMISKALAHQGRRGQNDVRVKEILLVNQNAEQNGLFDK